MRPGSHSWSLGSRGCALVVVGFIRGRSVHSGTLLGWSCSFGVFGFTRVCPGVVVVTQVRPGCRRGSLDSCGFALEFVGFIRRRRVRAVAPWWSSGSFGVVEFMWMRPGARGVHSWSLGSYGCALGVVARVPFGLGVHLASLGSRGCALGVAGFIRGCWVNAGAPWGWSGSFGVVVFTRVRPGGLCVHFGSLRSRTCALGVWGVQ